MYVKEEYVDHVNGERSSFESSYHEMVPNSTF